MNEADAAAPGAAPARYVGFWARCGATLIDLILGSIVVAPLARLFHVPIDIGPGFSSGLDLDDLLGSLVHPPSIASFTINLLLPAVAVVAFWFTRGATPGKMAISAVIVDARTLAPPSQGQMVARYLAYYVSMLPAGLGFVWIAFDRRKQGWHDKIAGTVVIRRPR